MAAAYRTSAVAGAVAGNPAPVITPAVDDLFVVFVTSNGDTTSTPTCTDDNGGTYTPVNTALWNVSANIVAVFVRDQFLANTTSTTVTVSPGTNTTSEACVVAVSGLFRAGLSAIRQSAVQANGLATTTPTTTFGVVAKTGNVTLTMVGDAVNPPGLTVPTGWTQRQNTGQTANGLQVCSRDSGDTSATITWGSVSTGTYATLSVELDSTASLDEDLWSYPWTPLLGAPPVPQTFIRDLAFLDPEEIPASFLFGAAASITYRTSVSGSASHGNPQTASGGGTSSTGNRSVSVTVASGDLLLVMCAASGNTNASPTCSDSDGGTYDLIATAAWGSSANMASAFIGKAGKTGAATITTTVATGSNTAAEITVFRLTGWTTVGIAAVVQSTVQQNQAAGGMPASTFSSNVQIGNLTVVFVANSSNPAGMSLGPPTNWTSESDVGQSTPSTGLSTAYRGPGFTGTSVAWINICATAFASMGIEISGGDAVVAMSITPVAGDLFMVVVMSDQAAVVSPTCTDDNGGTYALCKNTVTSLIGGSINYASFVRTALLPNATSTVVTVDSVASDAVAVVVAISGIVLHDGVIQSNGLPSNHTVRSFTSTLSFTASVTIPKATFNRAPLQSSLTVAICGENINPPDFSQPPGWSLRNNVGTPSQGIHGLGLQVSTRDTGYDTANVYWPTVAGQDGVVSVIEIQQSYKYDDDPLPFGLPQWPQPSALPAPQSTAIDGDFVFVSTAIVDDEDLWVSQVQPTPALLYQPLPLEPDPEELPAGSLLTGQPDEDLWLANHVTPPTLATLYRSPAVLDVEELPASTLNGQPDEDYDPRLLVVPPVLAALYRSSAVIDVEEVPANALRGQPDEDLDPRLLVAPPVLASIYRTPAVLDVEEVPAKTLRGQPDEDFWLTNHVAPPALAILYRDVAVLDVDEISATTLHGQSDEDYDPRLWIAPPTVATIYRTPAVLDVEELPADALRGQPDEDFDQRLLVAPPVVSALYQSPAVLDVEELPAGDLSGQPDEDFWINAVSSASQAFSTIVVDDQGAVGTIPATPDEDFDQQLLLISPVAAAVWPSVAQDDIDAPPLSGQSDEDLWINDVAPTSTAMWQRQPLGDQDEIPGGLSGQPDEDFDLSLQLARPETARLYQSTATLDQDEISAGQLHQLDDEIQVFGATPPIFNLVALYPDLDDVPVASLHELDEESQLFDAQPAIVYQSAPYPDLDDAPADSLHQLDDEIQTFGAQPPITYASIVYPDLDDAPADALHQLDEETQVFGTQPPVVYASPSYPDLDDVPGGELHQLDEDVEWRSIAMALDARPAPAPSDDGDLPVIVAAEEDQWTSPTSARESFAQLPPTDDDQISLIAIDDDAWSPPMPWSILVAPSQLIIDDPSLGPIIRGTVVDCAGNPITNADVRLFLSSDNSLVAATVSDSSGVFAFVGLSPGTLYWIEASNSADTLVGTTLRNLTAV